ncbi:MAG TPA: PQQ-binding-like beta-propeller repeat protein [Acidimicrobiales bacterium]|nr:PQQ-binding-like beta-propeller repeat protein [Acidimicrobiales bacterium]
MAAILVVGLLVAVVVSRRGPPALGIPWRLQAGSALVGAAQLEGGDLFVATRDGTVVAAAAGSGDPRWRFETGERLQAAPVVGGGLMYVATEVGESGSASLFAVDARTGTEQWGATVDVPITGQLVLDGGLVYVPAGDVVAFDALTGEERWRAAPGTGVVSVTAGSGAVVVTGTSGLTALDGLTGDERWTVPTAGLLPVAPAMAGEGVIAGDGGGHLVGRDLSDGAERWRAPDAGLVQPPVVTGPLIVLPTSDGVVALSSSTGEQRWERELNGDPAGDDTVRVASDGVAVAATSGGELTLLHATTGEVLGAAHLDGEVPATPAVADGRVYVAQGETVTAFDRRAG